MCLFIIYNNYPWLRKRTMRLSDGLSTSTLCPSSDTDQPTRHCKILSTFVCLLKRSILNSSLCGVIAADVLAVDEDVGYSALLGQREQLILDISTVSSLL